MACFQEGWTGTEYTFPGYVFWLLFGINFRAKVHEAGGRKWEKILYNSSFQGYSHFLVENQDSDSLFKQNGSSWVL